MKILITGASGFLGSALARRLASAGHDISLLLRATSSTRRIAGIRATIGSCDSPEAILAFVKGFSPDVVVHTACAYGRQGEGAVQLLDANVRYGVTVLDALRGLKPLGEPRLFVNTGTSLPAEVSAYALGKQQFAQWGHREVVSAADAMRFVNVQLEHMYGPGDDPSKFPTHVLHTCHRNDPQLKLTAGEQIRDFIYVDDVVSAYETLLTEAGSLGPFVDIAVGSGHGGTVRSFVEKVRELTGSRTELQFGALPYRASEAMRCVADISRMKELGWQPAYDLEAGLTKMIDLEF